MILGSKEEIAALEILRAEARDGSGADAAAAAYSFLELVYGPDWDAPVEDEPYDLTDERYGDPEADYEA